MSAHISADGTATEHYDALAHHFLPHLIAIPSGEVGERASPPLPVWLMCGRRARCKRNLPSGLRSGTSLPAKRWISCGPAQATQTMVTEEARVSVRSKSQS